MTIQQRIEDIRNCLLEVESHLAAIETLAGTLDETPSPPYPYAKASDQVKAAFDALYGIVWDSQHNEWLNVPTYLQVFESGQAAFSGRVDTIGLAEIYDQLASQDYDMGIW